MVLGKHGAVLVAFLGTDGKQEERRKLLEGVAEAAWAVGPVAEASSTGVLLELGAAKGPDTTGPQVIVVAASGPPITRKQLAAWNKGGTLRMGRHPRLLSAQSKAEPVPLPQKTTKLHSEATLLPQLL
jgi:hypothetical protein